MQYVSCFLSIFSGEASCCQCSTWTCELLFGAGSDQMKHIDCTVNEKKESETDTKGPGFTLAIWHISKLLLCRVSTPKPLVLLQGPPKL